MIWRIYSKKIEQGARNTMLSWSNYLLLGLAWESALPATDLLAFPYLPSRKILDAVEATLRLVCFLFDFGISILLSVLLHNM